MPNFPNITKISPFTLPGLILCGLAAMALFSLTLASNAQGEEEIQASILTRAEVEIIIREYLLENPELIFEAAAVYERRQQEAQNVEARAAITELTDFLMNNPEAGILGNPEGDVTIVEFFDYNCGYCKRAYGAVKQLLEEDGNLRHVLKQFPILGEESDFAARIALAAQKQGQYAELHDRMMTHQGRLSESTVLSMAQELGLDMAQLAADAESDSVRQTIEETRNAATRLNITGTPGYIFETEIVRGALPYERMKEVVANIRAERAEENGAP